MFDLKECESFVEILERKHEDFPQIITAGWMLPSGILVGATCNVAQGASDATVGKTAAAYAACLAAVLKRLQQLAETNPGVEDAIIHVVEHIVQGMTVAKRLRNSLVTKEALEAICAAAGVPE